MKHSDKKKRVLFICTHNSARSHMAEGLVNARYGDQFEAYSAGTEPSKVNPYAVKVMAEMGIDISKHQSKGVEALLEQDLDYVVTVCDQANETCPLFTGGKERIHKGFKDPSAFEGSEEGKLATFRRVRDEIQKWIEETFSSGD